MAQRIFQSQVLIFITVRQPRLNSPNPPILGQPAGTKNRMEAPPIMTITKRASCFTFRRIHLFLSQSRSDGPNNSLFKSQPCIRGEDLAKQAAASNTNGVVGRSGRTTPILPRSRKKIPSVIQAYKGCYRSSFTGVGASGAAPNVLLSSFSNRGLTVSGSS